MEGTPTRADEGAVDLDRFVDATAADLVVASNRQPYRHDYAAEGEGIEVDRPAGGLTAGLDAVMQRMEGTWIAWGDGDADEAVVDEDDRVAVPPDDPTYDLRRLWFDDETIEDYYYRTSNQVLWPICHAALGTVEPLADAWSAYRSVNAAFAEAITDAAGDDSIVWLQDYHLALAPRLVRERADGEPFIAHTWHVPWPAEDTFRACPHAEEILDGLLGNDLLGFHVERYCRNFLETVEATLPAATVDREAGRVTYRDETTHVRAYPMGVAAERIREQAGNLEARGFREFFLASHSIDRETTLAVGVDRLDYTKGIPERLAALETLFEEYSRWREELTYVQVGTESRSWIPAYARYQDRIEEAVADLNERFGTDDWQPVVYTTDYLSNEALAGLYRAADAAIVSPIRDGMNLVAQEYVAAQAGDDDGVLVLSDQAGAHDVLGEWTVSIRPHDTTGFADAIDDALTMPADERRRRHEALESHVFAHDVDAWLADVLGTITSLGDVADREPMMA